MTLAWAVLRIALGTGALLAPSATTTFWVGRDATSPAGTVLGRALAGRDLALGIGMLAAVRNGGPVRPWVLTAGLADAVDALGTARSRRSMPAGRRDLVIAASAGSAALAAVLGRSGR